ncbi:ABC transporter ATP-binding protein [Candidatus Microgenomates bacterium]|nr:MAG: ABC transporter ATP-binding protein [Candidatus Microgenomates bacterium]
MKNTVLEVKNLTKQFGTFMAVDNISFSVAEGEIVGLLGPNGAGKTTTIQMLIELMYPTKGTIRYFGKPLRQHRTEILKRINHMSGYSQLPWRLKVNENLRVFATLYEVKNWQEKVEDLAERFGVMSFINKRFQDLSAGQKTRTLLVKAFLNDPEIILLDEPTASLDPDIADNIRKFILSERKRRKLTILITSHNMQEVEELCDKVVFLHHGKILAIDTPEGLANKNKQSELQLMVQDGLKRLIQAVSEHRYAFEESHRFIKITLPEQDVAQFLLAISKKGVEYSDIEIVRPSLEDFFLTVSHQQRNSV